MYGTARYFTMTGNPVPGTPTTIEIRIAELAQLHKRIFGGAEHSKAPDRNTVSGGHER